MRHVHRVHVGRTGLHVRQLRTAFARQRRRLVVRRAVRVLVVRDCGKRLAVLADETRRLQLRHVHRVRVGLAGRHVRQRRTAFARQRHLVLLRAVIGHGQRIHAAFHVAECVRQLIDVHRVRAGLALRHVRQRHRARRLPATQRHRVVVRRAIGLLVVRHRRNRLAVFADQARRLQLRHVHRVQVGFARRHVRQRRARLARQRHLVLRRAVVHHRQRFTGRLVEDATIRQRILQVAQVLVRREQLRAVHCVRARRRQFGCLHVRQLRATFTGQRCRLVVRRAVRVLVVRDCRKRLAVLANEARRLQLRHVHRVHIRRTGRHVRQLRAAFTRQRRRLVVRRAVRVLVVRHRSTRVAITVHQTRVRELVLDVRDVARVARHTTIQVLQRIAYRVVIDLLRIVRRIDQRVRRRFHLAVFVHRRATTQRIRHALRRAVQLRTVDCVFAVRAHLARVQVRQRRALLAGQRHLVLRHGVVRHRQRVHAAFHVADRLRQLIDVHRVRAGLALCNVRQRHRARRLPAAQRHRVVVRRAIGLLVVRHRRNRLAVFADQARRLQLRHVHCVQIGFARRHVRQRRARLARQRHLVLRRAVVHHRQRFTGRLVEDATIRQRVLQVAQVLVRREQLRAVHRVRARRRQFGCLHVRQLRATFTGQRCRLVVRRTVRVLVVRDCGKRLAVLANEARRLQLRHVHRVRVGLASRHVRQRRARLATGQRHLVLRHGVVRHRQRVHAAFDLADRLRQLLDVHRVRVGLALRNVRQRHRTRRLPAAQRHRVVVRRAIGLLVVRHRGNRLAVFADQARRLQLRHVHRIQVGLARRHVRQRRARLARQRHLVLRRAVVHHRQRFTGRLVEDTTIRQRVLQVAQVLVRREQLRAVHRVRARRRQFGSLHVRQLRAAFTGQRCRLVVRRTVRVLVVGDCSQRLAVLADQARRLQLRHVHRVQVGRTGLHIRQLRTAFTGQRCRLVVRRTVRVLVVGDCGDRLAILADQARRLQLRHVHRIQVGLARRHVRQRRARLARQRHLVLRRAVVHHRQRFARRLVEDAAIRQRVLQVAQVLIRREQLRAVHRVRARRRQFGSLHVRQLRAAFTGQRRRLVVRRAVRVLVVRDCRKRLAVLANEARRLQLRHVHRVRVGLAGRHVRQRRARLATGQRHLVLRHGVVRHRQRVHAAFHVADRLRQLIDVHRVRAGLALCNVRQRHRARRLPAAQRHRVVVRRAIRLLVVRHRGDRLAVFADQARRLQLRHVHRIQIRRTGLHVRQRRARLARQRHLVLRRAVVHHRQRFARRLVEDAAIRQRVLQVAQVLVRREQLRAVHRVRARRRQFGCLHVRQLRATFTGQRCRLVVRRTVRVLVVRDCGDRLSVLADQARRLQLRHVHRVHIGLARRDVRQRRASRAGQRHLVLRRAVVRDGVRVGATVLRHRVQCVADVVVRRVADLVSRCLDGAIGLDARATTERIRHARQLAHVHRIVVFSTLCDVDDLALERIRSHGECIAAIGNRIGAQCNAAVIARRHTRVGTQCNGIRDVLRDVRRLAHRNAVHGTRRCHRGVADRDRALAHGCHLIVAERDRVFGIGPCSRTDRQRACAVRRDHAADRDRIRVVNARLGNTADRHRVVRTRDSLQTDRDRIEPACASCHADRGGRAQLRIAAVHRCNVCYAAIRTQPFDRDETARLRFDVTRHPRHLRVELRIGGVHRIGQLLHGDGIGFVDAIADVDDPARRTYVTDRHGIGARGDRVDADGDRADARSASPRTDRQRIDVRRTRLRADRHAVLAERTGLHARGPDLDVLHVERAVAEVLLDLVLDVAQAALELGHVDGVGCGRARRDVLQRDRLRCPRAAQRHAGLARAVVVHCVRIVAAGAARRSRSLKCVADVVVGLVADLVGRRRHSAVRVDSRLTAECGCDARRYIVQLTAVHGVLAGRRDLAGLHVRDGRTARAAQRNGALRRIPVYDRERFAGRRIDQAAVVQRLLDLGHAVVGREQLRAVDGVRAVRRKRGRAHVGELDRGRIGTAEGDRVLRRGVVLHRVLRPAARCRRRLQRVADVVVGLAADRVGRLLDVAVRVDGSLAAQRGGHVLELRNVDGVSRLRAATDVDDLALETGGTDRYRLITVRFRIRTECQRIIRIHHSLIADRRRALPRRPRGLANRQRR
ncbi:hypothetical protein BCO18442_07466 [Burkholderia contaminans]|nr:hypothetical protein BCO18442_07466 [Burkholderia contaminans]